MIIPITNISFQGIKRKSNIIKQTISPEIEKKDFQYPKIPLINFTSQLNINKIDFEYGIQNNFFKLPQVTLSDGTVVQIQPDKSQLECAKKLSEGKSVLFDAPTGMGKTAVAHFVMGKNMAQGKKTVYTVPIKALANDKYAEFSKKYGKNNVGILTGDRKINANAPIVIMTTEIWDNQAQGLDENEASKIGTVIYDEAHYLADEERGFAWEHSMINSGTKGIQMLLLSATIGNADEIASWLDNLSENIKVERVSVSPQERPVPLIWHLYSNDPNQPFKRIMEGEVELKKLEDKTSEIKEFIYQCERYEEELRIKKSLEEKGLSYDEDDINIQLDEKFNSRYREQISERLVGLFGENWLRVDFDDEKNIKKLNREFPALNQVDINKLTALIKQSGTNVLTDRQKRALEIIYRAQYNSNLSYQMTDKDYEYTYQELRRKTAQNQQNSKVNTRTFKKILERQFYKLDESQLEQVTQLISKANVKNINAIHENWQPDDYTTLVEKLRNEDMLPAIIFKLAQNGCEQVAESLAGENEDENTAEAVNEQSMELDLLSLDEKQEVREIIKKYKNQGVYLGIDSQEDMLLRGWAVHHAGRMPQYKKLIEELFSKKLIKVVVATSTLGAGINMPARSVVMTNTAYAEYNDKEKQFEYVPLNANEFHQMTGRAGRRGIDNIGNVVLYNLHTPQDRFNKDDPNARKDKSEKIDELWRAYHLMNSEPDPIRSNFRPQPVMLAKYFSEHGDLQDIWKLIKSSLKIHLAKDPSKVEKQMYKKFENFTQVLLKQGYVFRNHKKQYTLTPKGEILALSQGMNPLMVAGALYDEKLANLEPAQLAQFAAHIQNDDNYAESDALKQLIQGKIAYLEKDEDNLIFLDEYLEVAGIFNDMESTIHRVLNEANVNKTEIRYSDSFSGLVGYMFARLNEINPDDSINNFEKIYMTQNIQTSADTKLNKNYERKATEGNIYKIITGAISTLKQITNICDWAISAPDLYPNTSYWEKVKENAQIAIDLLDKEPINNDPEYANKLSNI